MSLNTCRACRTRSRRRPSSAAAAITLVLTVGCNPDVGKWKVDVEYDPIHDHNFSSIELRSDSGIRSGGLIRMYCMVGPRLVVDWTLDSVSRQEFDTLYGVEIRFDQGAVHGPYELPAHSSDASFARHDVEADTTIPYWATTATDSLLLAGLPEAKQLVLRFHSGHSPLDSILSRDVFWDVRGYGAAFTILDECRPRSR